MRNFLTKEIFLPASEIFYRTNKMKVLRKLRKTQLPSKNELEEYQISQKLSYEYKKLIRC